MDHSLSPTLHNAAFRALDLDWVYTAFEVGPGAGAGAVAAMRALRLGGLSVTMPLKTEVARAVDDVTAAAAALDAVNCVYWRGGRLIGDNTDGAGLVWSLAECDGVDVSGARCLVLGAGGAARSVVAALGDAGAERVAVTARRETAAAHAARLASGAGVAVSWDERGAAAADTDVIVNATPIGMGDDGASPLPGVGFGSGQVVVDLVYHPRWTSLLADADAAGARAVDGLGMLCGQAALAFSRWTGLMPDLGVFRGALISELPASG